MQWQSRYAASPSASEYFASRPTDGGDVYDWIEAGGTADQLAQATELADDRRPDEKADGWRSHVFTAATLRTMAFPPVSYVVPGIIQKG